MDDDLTAAAEALLERAVPRIVEIADEVAGFVGHVRNTELAFVVIGADAACFARTVQLVTATVAQRVAALGFVERERAKAMFASAHRSADGALVVAVAVDHLLALARDIDGELEACLREPLEPSEFHALTFVADGVYCGLVRLTCRCGTSLCPQREVLA